MRKKEYDRKAIYTIEELKGTYTYGSEIYTDTYYLIISSNGNAEGYHELQSYSGTKAGM